MNRRSLRLVPRRRHLTAALLAAVAMLLAVPAPAAAHATLLFTTPAVDGAVAESPVAIQLIFDQPVAAAGSAITVRAPGGRQVAIGASRRGSSPRVIQVQVNETLAPGGYVVGWTAGAPDGDAMIGEFRFAVGSSRGLSIRGSTVNTRASVPTAALRWALFLGLSLALGGLVANRLVRRLPEPRSEQRPWVRMGAAIGLAAVAGLAAIQLGGSANDASGSLAFLASSAPGRVVLAEGLAFAFVAVHRWRDRWSASALFLVPLAEGWRAHPQAAIGTLGAALTAVHLAAAAIWIGALVHVLRVARDRQAGQSNVGLVGAYSRLALLLVVAILTTGTLAAIVELAGAEQWPSSLTTTYGKWLTVKVALVVGIVLLAVWGRRFLTRHPDRPQPAKTATYEAGALIAVLAISGILTALAPPRQSDAGLPFPPPAIGPTVGVGGRAGYIGIGAIASQGQLVVRLATPDISAGITSEDGAARIAGNIAAPGNQSPARLRFRACGPGCFVAPVTWRDGLNTVSLNAYAAGWTGGKTALQIAWPARSAAGRLRAVVDATRKVTQLTLHEQVSSDTSAGLGILSSLETTGTEFLDSEPYGSGVAPMVTQRPGRDGTTLLSLAYPAEGTFVLLTISPDDRVLHETLATRSHLVTRTFVYDEAASAP